MKKAPLVIPSKDDLQKEYLNALYMQSQVDWQVFEDEMYQVIRAIKNAIPHICSDILYHYTDDWKKYAVMHACISMGLNYNHTTNGVGKINGHFKIWGWGQ